VLCLGSNGGGGALAKLAAGRFAGPCAGIDFTHDVQPFLGFGERCEITHVETKALATFLEAAAYGKVEALELGQLRLRQSQRRGR
jgi:hypothetical protein